MKAVTTGITTTDKVEAALKELVSFDTFDLDFQTAHIQACRAVAAMVLYCKQGDVKWLCAATNFKHEALEHAALCESKYTGIVQQLIVELVDIP